MRSRVSPSPAVSSTEATPGICPDRRAGGDLALEDSAHDGPPREAASQLLRRPFRDDPAAVDDEDAVADGVDLGKDVSREKHRPLAAERADHFADLDDLHRVEADRGLVENQHRRLMDESPGERGPLPIALGKIVDLAVRDFREKAALRPPPRRGSRTRLPATSSRRAR